MPVSATARVHPTALISAEATIGDHVEIGAFSVIEGPVTLGPDCAIATHVRLMGPLVMGRGNTVGSGAVFGDFPQHGGYRGEPTGTEIGDFNTFREHVTVHRGSHVAGAGTTRIGNHNYFMVNSHVAHDALVANQCIIANGALIAGHCEIQDRVFMSGNSALHQFVRMGRLSLLSGCEGASQDIIPFVVAENRNRVSGVNVIGLKRAGMPAADIAATRKAFTILYRSNLIFKLATDRLREEMGAVPVVAEILAFIATSRRGIIRAVTERDDEGWG